MISSDEAQPLPTINIFELWEEGSQQAQAVSARDFHFLTCFAAMCPWNYQNKPIPLREAVEGVANNSRHVAKQYGVADHSLSPGTHFPNQPTEYLLPGRSGGESVSLSFDSFRKEYWGLAGNQLQRIKERGHAL